MVDTGWQTHPFFTSRGYRVDPTLLGPGTADAGVDENGHGTGESANIFATAPDVTLKPVKAATASGALVNLTAAFNAAVALNPHIISNSWTSDVRFGPLSAALQARAAAVAAAWGTGIVVVFAAGNGHWGFPGQHPDVISVGGVDIAIDGSLRASNYASGFMSNIYPGRRVPDMSGIVGMLPKAMNIMLPLPPGSAIDTGNAGGSHPTTGDETKNNDGWAAFSGTSAACPQVAGVCALIKEACMKLTPAQVRDILIQTARDVTTGTCNPNTGGNAATAGPDLATGSGLVDAHKAVLLAKVRCLKFPLQPFLPSIPVQPFQPALPLQPFTPAIPLRPIAPTLPFRPIAPALPLQPFAPLRPFAPFGPGPGPDPGPFTAGQGLTSDDIEALERLIIDEGELPGP
jgi:subtilisin family serine protease